MLLYAVTEDSPGSIQELCSDAEAALTGGVTFLQLRLKSAPREKTLEAATALKTLAAKYSVPFVINDDPSIAAKTDCDGVHVGQSDISAEDARIIIGPDKILGVSVQTPQEAIAAEKAGADYLGVGAVFPSGTKTDAAIVSKQTLAEICRSVSIPVVAIGGITRENMRELTGTGIAGSALVSAIFGQNDIRKAASDLLACSLLTTMKAAVFDLDGTLLDSMPVWSNVGIDYIKSLGITPKPDTWARLLPMTMRQSADYFATEYGIGKTADEIIAEVNMIPKEAYAHKIRFKPYALEFLRSLKRLGIPMCIATATDRILVESALKRLGALDLFEFIITSSEFGSGKEKAGIFRYSIEKLGGTACDTVIFEDAWHAIRTACNDGLRVIALQDDSARPHDDEIKMLADVYFDSFKEVII